MTTRPYRHWLAQLQIRWRAYWLLKGIGITACITLFMAVYFALLRHPQHAVTVMPLVALDHWVGFVPWAVWPYASLWLYIGIAPGLLLLRSEMWRYLLAVILVATIGCGIFYFWPTMVPEFALDWSRWPVLNLIKSTDATGNACPSLHVAFAVLTAIWLQQVLREVRAPRSLHAVNLAWCVLIVWSTMATRQHVAVDVGAGVLLGAGVTLASLKLLPGVAVAPPRAATVEWNASDGTSGNGGVNS